MKVYAAGVLKIDFNDDRKSPSTRLWYLFKKFADAERCILENQSDIFECLYNYALIEEITLIPYSKKESLLNCNQKQWWYKAEYKGCEIVINKTSVPEQFKNTCNWWVG